MTQPMPALQHNHIDRDGEQGGNGRSADQYGGVFGVSPIKAGHQRRLGHRRQGGLDHENFLH